MARGGSAETDLYAFVTTASVAERVARYRQEAERFRQMAQREIDRNLYDELMTLAKEYDDLANSLMPPKA